MSKKVESYRQGDVLLLRVAALPKQAIEFAYQSGPIVLAYGEVTGHQHAIYDVLNDVTQAPKVRVWDAGAERYLQVLEAVTLKHEEHTAHTIAPGIYHLPQQVEYSPAELRRVAD